MKIKLSSHIFLGRGAFIYSFTAVRYIHESFFLGRFDSHLSHRRQLDEPNRNNSFDNNFVCYSYKKGFVMKKKTIFFYK